MTALRLRSIRIHLGMIVALDRSGRRTMTDDERDAVEKFMEPKSYLMDLHYKEVL